MSGMSGMSGMNLKNQYALQKGSRSDNLDAKNGDRNFERADNKSGPDMPDRFELFTLGDGEKKIEEVTDTRVPSCSIFTFNKEDHTLGNMLAQRLLKNPAVQFSGYKVPHPLFAKFELRVQTDGSITPRAALIASCRDLVQDLSVFSREFTKEVELRRLATETGADGR